MIVDRLTFLNRFRSLTSSFRLRVVYAVFSEILFLIFLVAGVPLFSGWLYFSLEKYNNFKDEAFLTLLLGIGLNHIFLYLNKNRSSENILRYIDYIYLSIAATGAYLAASDLADSDYKTRLNSTIAQSFQDMEKFYDQNSDTFKILCTDQFRFDCTIINKVARDLNDRAHMLRYAASEHNFKIAMKQIIEIVRQSPRLDSILQRDEFGIYNDYRLSLYMDVDLPDIDFRTENTPREAGYLFILSAIALRITRVSVELFGWFIKVKK